MYIHDHLHSQTLSSVKLLVFIIIVLIKLRVFGLHNNDGSDDSAVKVGLTLQGQRKKTFDKCVNENLSKDEQGDTSVRCTVRDYIDRL